MSIGYEGYVKVAGQWALGTGSAIPASRTRLDSSSAYAGKITGVEMGIGLPHTYDWSTWDGSVDFEMTAGLFAALKTWIVTTRDMPEIIEVSSRTSNLQKYDESIWNAISISASEGSLVTGSLSFVAMSQTSYVYGTNTVGKNGSGSAILALDPIPYWNTSIGSYKFVTWTLDFSQEVVKLFACNNNVGPQGPAYYGVGPMTVSLSGAYILGTDEMPDSLGDLVVTVGSSGITLKKTELQTQNDDIQTGNNLTPITVSVDAYEVV